MFSGLTSRWMIPCPWAYPSAAANPHGLGQRELGLARQPLPQRLPVNERHGEPEPAGRLAGIVHGEDVGVVETRGEPNLPNEPLRTQHLRKLRMQNLQGDRTVVPEIAGEIDRGHAATAELALERVAVRQGGFETFKGLEQRDLSNKGSSRL